MHYMSNRFDEENIMPLLEANESDLRLLEEAGVLEGAKPEEMQDMLKLARAVQGDTRHLALLLADLAVNKEMSREYLNYRGQSFEDFLDKNKELIKKFNLVDTLITLIIESEHSILIPVITNKIGFFAEGDIEKAQQQIFRLRAVVNPKDASAFKQAVVQSLADLEKEEQRHL